MTPQCFREAVNSWRDAHTAINTPLTTEERALVENLVAYVLACWTPSQELTCFWCPQPAAQLLQGVAFCESHAICARCVKPLTMLALTCRCEKSGYAGHEELLYCSEECLEAAHPEALPSYNNMEHEQ